MDAFVTAEPKARSAAIFCARGEAAIERGDLRAAEDAFNHARRVDPQHAQALYRLGEFAYSRADFKGAAALFEHTLRAEAGHQRAQARLAELRPALDGAGVIGTVREFRRFNEPWLSARATRTVMNFAVEQNDGSSVWVAMRGLDQSGAIKDGDVVALPANWREGEQLEILRNLTSGQEVTLGGLGSSDLGPGIVLVLIGLSALVILPLVIAGLVFGLTPPELIDQFK